MPISRAARTSAPRKALFALVPCKMGAALLLPQLLLDPSSSLGRFEMRWSGNSSLAFTVVCSEMSEGGGLRCVGKYRPSGHQGLIGFDLFALREVFSFKKMYEYPWL